MFDLLNNPGFRSGNNGSCSVPFRPTEESVLHSRFRIANSVHMTKDIMADCLISPRDEPSETLPLQRRKSNCGIRDGKRLNGL